MEIYIPHHWIWFIGCLTLFFITSMIMQKQSDFFYTLHIIRKKFSIMDLEFPASTKSLKKLLNGIDNLPNHEGITVKKALKGQLYVDFLFMMAVYPAIFLLAMHTSHKMDFFGKYLFAGLAWSQLLAWLFDIIENIYLLLKIENPDSLYSDNYPPEAPENKKSYKKYLLYQRIVRAKWIIASLGAICSLFGMLYFWIIGSYTKFSLLYLAIIVFEILFVIAISAIKKGKSNIEKPI